VDRGQRNSCLARRTGSGRNHQIIGLQPGNFADGNGIVAANLHLLPQFAKVLDDVLGEAVAIIDHQQRVAAILLICMANVPDYPGDARKTKL
jgi:hypothetical protein